MILMFLDESEVLIKGKGAMSTGTTKGTGMTQRRVAQEWFYREDKVWV